MFFLPTMVECSFLFLRKKTICKFVVSLISCNGEYVLNLPLKTLMELGPSAQSRKPKLNITLELNYATLNSYCH